MMQTLYHKALRHHREKTRKIQVSKVKHVRVAHTKCQKAADSLVTRLQAAEQELFIL